MGLANGIPGNNKSNDFYESAEFNFALQQTAAHQTKQARQQGVAEGYDQGFANGQQVGYDKGWNDGIERGNRELLKADGYIRGHVADKERLQQTVSEQAQQIAQFRAHIAALEATIDRKDNAMRILQQSQLPDIARELQAENEQLQVQIQALQEDNDIKTRECTESAKKVNRAAVMVNSMRNTLTVLTADRESERTHEIEHVFCEEYQKEVARGLKLGVLSESLEDDQTFASTMPATHRFLTAILQSVNERIELERVGQQSDMDDDGNWVPDGS
jgi:hypothetical protein